MTYEPVSVESLLTHRDWALRLARRLVREDGEAEDLVQRTWMAALRRPPDSERGARAWIRKVILNLARERHRRGRTRERHERAFPRLEGDVPDALEVLSREEIRKTLSEQLLELSEPYRSVVLQRYYDGLSSVEIARRLGIPAGTVRWRLKVGLDQLRSGLDRRTQGDRSRWVSALILFAPGPLEEADDEPSAPVAPAEPAPALSLGPAGWIALAGASVLGLAIFARTLERGARGSEPAPAEAGLPVALDQGPRTAASPARAPLATDRAPVGGSSSSADLRILVVGEDGAPVSAARIEVASARGVEERTTSDDSGRARLAVRPEDPGALGLISTRGRVSVRALAAGRAASPLVHVAPPFSREHEVRLVVGGPEVRLTGHVTDGEGRPVSGALVAWYRQKQGLDHAIEGDFPSPFYLTATSDDEGEYTLTHLAADSGTLGCFAEGFAFASLGLDDHGPGPPDFVLQRGARVSGLVRWPDGRPAADVSIRCEPVLNSEEWATGLPGYSAEWRGFGETTRTDGFGRYRLESVKAGQRMLWARDERTGLVASTTLVLENQREEEWNPDLAERTGFRVQLVDETRQPLPGWVVHLRRPLVGNKWWIRRRATDAEGRLAVNDCPDIPVFLDVFGPNDVGASYAWRRLEPGAEEVVVEIDTRASSSVHGRILDAYGAPDLRGKIVFYSLRTTLTTPAQRDEEGLFEQRLPPGVYGFVLDHDRTATRLAHFKLEPGQSLDLGTLATPEMGTLRITSKGGKLRFSLFSVSETADDHGVMNVGHGDVDGEVLIPAFPGRYRVLTFGNSTGKPDENEVYVRSNVETRLDL